VKVPTHLDDDFLAREGTRQAQCHERGLGTGRDELDFAAVARTGYQLLDELAPLDLQRVAGAVVAALLALLGDRRGDLGVAMTEDQRAVA